MASWGQWELHSFKTQKSCKVGSCKHSSSPTVSLTLHCILHGWCQPSSTLQHHSRILSSIEKVLLYSRSKSINTWKTEWSSFSWALDLTITLELMTARTQSWNLYVKKQPMLDNLKQKFQITQMEMILNHVFKFYTNGLINLIAFLLYTGWPDR